MPIDNGQRELNAGPIDPTLHQQVTGHQAGTTVMSVSRDIRTIYVETNLPSEEILTARAATRWASTSPTVALIRMSRMVIMVMVMP